MGAFVSNEIHKIPINSFDSVKLSTFFYLSFASCLYHSSCLAVLVVFDFARIGILMHDGRILWAIVIMVHIILCIIAMFFRLLTLY